MAGKTASLLSLIKHLLNGFLNMFPEGVIIDKCKSVEPLKIFRDFCKVKYSFSWILTWDTQ